jgi:hypothetical protein
VARIASSLVLSALLAGAAPASAELYRWTDENGLERFTDRIEQVPEAHRSDGIRALRAEVPIAPPAPAGAAPPEEAVALPLPAPSAVGPELLAGWTGTLAALGLAAVVAAALFGIGLWLLLAAFALRLACRLVGEDVPGAGRAIGVSAAQFAAGIATGVVLLGVVVAGLADPQSAAFQGVQLLATLLVNAAVVRAMLVLAFGRALLVAGLALVIAAGIGVAAGLAIALLLGGLAAG